MFVLWASTCMRWVVHHSEDFIAIYLTLYIRKQGRISKLWWCVQVHFNMLHFRVSCWKSLHSAVIFHNTEPRGQATTKRGGCVCLASDSGCTRQSRTFLKSRISKSLKVNIHGVVNEKAVWWVQFNQKLMLCFRTGQ